MKKRVTVKGSSWQDAAEDAAISCGLPNTGGLLNDVTGFRLGHDSADRKCRGSRWFGSPNYARPPHSVSNTPDLSGLYLSFRLTREAE